MSNYEDSPAYLGDRYHHTKSGFSGVVVEETMPSPWLPERVVLTLESASGEKKAFPLTELEEVQ